MTFTLFSQNIVVVAGTGITITTNVYEDTISVNGQSLAGNYLLWNGSTCQFDVNPSGLTNIVNVCNVSGIYSATTNNNFIGATGGSVIYLPNSPNSGQKISVADLSGNALACNILVCSDTCKILNDQYATINTDYGSMSFIFNNTFWSAVAFTN